MSAKDGIKILETRIRELENHNLDLQFAHDKLVWMLMGICDEVNIVLDEVDGSDDSYLQRVLSAFKSSYYDILEDNIDVF